MCFTPWCLAKQDYLLNPAERKIAWKINIISSRKESLKHQPNVYRAVRLKLPTQRE